MTDHRDERHRSDKPAERARRRMIRAWRSGRGVRLSADELADFIESDYAVQTMLENIEADLENIEADTR